jgi:glycosyltransferase involved in cell wall biosynthesis
MKKSSLIDDYLRNYSAGEKWELVAHDIDHISQVVVIPAFAEKEMIFNTLASLAQNPPSSLEYSFIMCVVNNKNNSPAPVKENNLQTMECLNALVKRKSIQSIKQDKELYPLLVKVSDANMKLGYIDASSKGYEIPCHAGGVGMARKIGMDNALRLLRNNSSPNNVILSLDADTLVSPDYLSTVKKYFQSEVKTAIVAYEHQMPDDLVGQAAIVCYEIFLRYWVLGLQCAKSPWAFHSIGSTIAVSMEAYLEVRGMNKREAGEDFYFLNKLAKVGKIDYIKETCVYPSARSSARVPFGTGKRIQRFLEGGCKEEYCLYDPRIFSILDGWLQLMNSMLFGCEDEILIEAELIHPQLKNFLIENNFCVIWPRIRRTTKDKKTLAGHFHDWFDGFKTLKMINYFTREAYPQINMFSALNSLFTLSGISEQKLISGKEIPPLARQVEILRCLRRLT